MKTVCLLVECFENENVSVDGNPGDGPRFSGLTF